MAPQTTSPSVTRMHTHLATGRLDLLIIRERAGDDEVWVAQCLQYDIATQAKTLESLKRKFVRMFVSNIIIALENGQEPLANIKPAPQSYWDAYNQASEFCAEFPYSVPADRLPKRSVTPSAIPRGEAIMRLASTV
ncbi:MAG: hypothetical protein AB1813_21060 [Verrucomicrobiota bacterium]